MATPSAIVCDDLWFSYEVAQNISSTAKLDIDVASYGKSLKTRTADGGLSIDAPRQQHATSWGNHELVYKLQLKGINMDVPVGSRTMLVGANGAGKTTLMSCIGGKHLISNHSAVRVLGRSAFEDTTLAAELALLTGNWTHTVAFAGHNVPYQAMEVSRLISSNSVGVEQSRVDRLVSLLEIDSKWNLTTVSDGQRRRVQILCKLIKPFKVLLLDEITADLDILARHDLLTFLREESEQRGVTILYCTHIFDGLDGWASHVAYIEQGEMKFSAAVEALTDRLVKNEAQRARGWGTLFCAVQRWLLEARPDFAALLTEAPRAAAFVPPAALAGLPPAVKVSGFTWKYSQASSKPQLNDVSFEIPRGARCLLVGANGAGKTTMLRLLGGKHMVPTGQVQCLGLNAFHDIELNTKISMLSGDWTRQVACVGNGVPFQADFSVGYMAESLADALIRDGLPEALVRARLARLVALLDMNLEWRLHQVSDGQRRRAQLLLKLLRPSELLLMDEVTTDLDVVSRQALLQFLREECDERGATVVYSTHILDGLDDWPSHVLHLQDGRVRFNGLLTDAPGAAASLGAADDSGSGSLFSLVKSWLLSEREAKAAQAMDVQCDATPPTAMAVDPPPPPAPTPPPSKASKFDRFGGASRQSMYG